MLYQIHHQTDYHYQQLVFLKPQICRLRPRSNGWQQLKQFSLTVTPQPIGIAEITELDGNNLQHFWFTEPTEVLSITTNAIVETQIDNPFLFLLEPWAVSLPFDYPTSLYRQLQPYWQPYSVMPDPVAIALGQQIAHDSQRNPLIFLSTLTQRLYEDCDYTLREHGQPWEAGITWGEKQGSCRDLTILFMEVCRAVGLATRFVSGYQEGDQTTEDWELHAWAEVYLPGGGWRGYVPTHGLAVGDRHIALVASPIPSYCAPISGQITPVRPISETGRSPQAQMQSKVKVSVINNVINSEQQQSQFTSLELP